MPQGRRKVPFSAKQKKQQLQQKREKKQTEDARSGDTTLVSGFSKPKSQFEGVDVINEQPSASGPKNPNRYRLMFKKEKDEEIRKKKALAMEPYEPLPEEALEVSYEDVYKPGSELDMPKRPPWDFNLSKRSLDMQEQKYFREYIENLEAKFGEQELSHFDLNLETWRQLWRVLEFSDIILLVVDIRFPVYHFSPALYDYVTKDLKKSMILVLNKIDLVPAPLVLAWQEYFKEHFPKLKVMCFASYAGMILKEGKKGKRVGNLHMAITGARHLLKLCEEIVEEQVDLNSWKTKIDEEFAQLRGEGSEECDLEGSDSGSEDDDRKYRKGEVKHVANDTSYYVGERYIDGTLTVGFVGHPNVGKSSFLNAVCGKKVVSVSRTPGHTKHFQTIMLTKNVRLCDCPGLVFPSLVPKPVQVLMGCYPIAQLREHFSAIEFLGRRVAIQNILRLRHPGLESFDRGEKVTWCAFDICEAWAEKRGFRTAKAARLDVNRAANNILRMALDGRTFCLAFYPPNYTKQKEMWTNHPGLAEITATQSHRKKQDPERKHQELEFISETLEKQSQSESSGEDDSEEADSEESEEGAKTGANKFQLLGADDFTF